MVNCDIPLCQWMSFFSILVVVRGVTEFTNKADKHQSSTIGVIGIFLDELSFPAGDSTHRA
jgi:hypothetical protein